MCFFTGFPEQLRGYWQLKTRHLYLVKVMNSVNFASRLMMFREHPYIMTPDHNVCI
jgi:hypothetical protein